MAASPVSGRCVYSGVAEHSVYVHPTARGQGTGRRLLEALIASTEAAGIWTIQSGIFPKNTASMALHRAAGFRVVGTCAARILDWVGCLHCLSARWVQWWLACGVLLKIAYLLMYRMLGLAVLGFRSDRTKDAELLVLRHENAVLRRNAGRVQYEPGDRVWFAALAGSCRAGAGPGSSP